jgi:hypothetical protein
MRRDEFLGGTQIHLAQMTGLRVLLSLSGADASWPMHDLYGLPLDRIPGVIANTVQLIVEQLKGRSSTKTAT